MNKNMYTGISNNIPKDIDILEIGTPVRLISLNFYNMNQALIKYFRFEKYCDETSQALQDLGIKYRIERIHSLWQTMQYTIEDYAYLENCGKVVYHIMSADEKSHLIVPKSCVEEIREYVSPYTIED